MHFVRFARMDMDVSGFPVSDEMLIEVGRRADTGQVASEWGKLAMSVRSMVRELHRGSLGQVGARGGLFESRVLLASEDRYSGGMLATQCLGWLLVYACSGKEACERVVRELESPRAGAVDIDVDSLAHAGRNGVEMKGGKRVGRPSSFAHEIAVVFCVLARSLVGEETGRKLLACLEAGGDTLPWASLDRPSVAVVRGLALFLGPLLSNPILGNSARGALANLAFGPPSSMSLAAATSGSETGLEALVQASKARSRAAVLLADAAQDGPLVATPSAPTMNTTDPLPASMGIHGQFFGGGGGRGGSGGPPPPPPPTKHPPPPTHKLPAPPLPRGDIQKSQKLELSGKITRPLSSRAQAPPPLPRGDSSVSSVEDYDSAAADVGSQPSPSALDPVPMPSSKFLAESMSSSQLRNSVKRRPSFRRDTATSASRKTKTDPRTATQEWLSATNLTLNSPPH